MDLESDSFIHYSAQTVENTDPLWGNAIIATAGVYREVECGGGKFCTLNGVLSCTLSGILSRYACRI